MCHQLSGVSLGTKSSCKEWMSGRCCWCSMTPLALRTWAEAGRITITSASGTNPPRAGVLESCPSPRLFLCAPAVCACPGHWDQLPWESSGACCAPGEGPAALGSAQPGHQSLCVQPWVPALCCSSWDPRREELGVSAKKIPKPERPVAINTKPCIFTEVYE